MSMLDYTSMPAFWKSQVEISLSLAGFLFVFLAPQLHVIILFYSESYTVTISLCIGEFLM